MTRFSKAEISTSMEEAGMIPVFNHPDISTTITVVEACYQAGINVFEFTNRGEEAFEVFNSLVKIVRAEMPGMMLGVGSIVDEETSELYLESGADFIVSPILSESVARKCNHSNVMWIPGCGTLTEIFNAQQLGAEVVKLFPGSVLGPEFVKAVLGPCPWSRIMPTGGVLPEQANLKSWFDAGVHCVGMGSKLFSDQLIQDQEKLKQKLLDVVTIIKKIRG